MYVCYVTSFTTHIHETTSQKETDISNWLTDGEKRNCQKRLARFDMHYFYNILKKYLSGNIKKEEFLISSLLSKSEPQYLY